MIGWGSKTVGRGCPLTSQATSHWVEENGQTACSREPRADGQPRLAPFRCAWGPRFAHDHVCGSCIRMGAPAVECVCGKCTANRARRSA